MPEPLDPAAEMLRRRRGRSVAIVVVLLLLAVLLYALTIVRVGAN